MIARYQALAQRIQTELSELERTQSVIQRHWKNAITAPVDQDAYINSVALNLHSWYSGLERILEMIATEIDGGPPGGENWHAELLRQISLDLPAVRPAVLRQTTIRQLDDYRKFRHRIRNVYAMNLDPNRMEDLVRNLPALWTQIQGELSAFVRFLETLSHADESEE